VITLNWFKKTQTNEKETLEKESTQNIETKQVDNEHSLSFFKPVQSNHLKNT